MTHTSLDNPNNLSVHTRMAIDLTPQQRSAMQLTSSHCAAINLRKASRAISQFYDHALEPSGLTSTQFTLLVGTAVHAPVAITVLAGHLVMDRTTLTRDLQRLEDRGMIETVPGSDRRSKLIALTELGLEAIAIAVPLRGKAQRHIVESIGQERLEFLLETIELVVGAVKSD
jgi:DNA-binding MarR family transcriptional regulator